MATENDQVAAHEAGHCVVSQAVGIEIKGIVCIPGRYPGSHLPASVDYTFATDFVNMRVVTDFRFTYLAALGGIAGELVAFGYVEPFGAQDDLHHLRNAGLPNDLICDLSDVAVDIIRDNLAVWNKIRTASLPRISQRFPTILAGIPLTNLFKSQGKRLTDLARLDQLISREDVGWENTETDGTTEGAE
jgi:hypothetical protein